MIFRNDQHKAAFEKEIQLHDGCGKEVTAALYLLTADPRLWRQVERHVGTKSIDIGAMKLHRLDGMAYGKHKTHVHTNARGNLSAYESVPQAA